MMSSWDEALRATRIERDRFMLDHYASPLPDEDKEAFAGLAYFDPAPAWRLQGSFTAAEPHRIPIPSSSGNTSDYTRLGTVALTVDGAGWTVTVLDDGDGNPFIPFRDGTSGSETYEGGRYVDLVIEQDGTATVDFNDARNPWCVYDEEYVCPLPPPENTTHVPIRAGERALEGHTRI